MHVTSGNTVVEKRTLNEWAIGVMAKLLGWDGGGAVFEGD